MECALSIEIKQLSWNDIKEVFYDKYSSQFVQDEKEEEFFRLVQDSMIVAQYETKFTELSRFTSHVIVNDYKNVKRFLKGLRKEIRAKISTTLLQSYA